MEASTKDIADSRSQCRDRHHGEVSMESFIRHQMMVILQPLEEHVQDLDERVAQLTEGLRRTDANAAETLKKLGSNMSETVSLRDGLSQANMNLSMARQAIAEASERDEMLQQGMELANGFAQRMHNKLEGCAGTVPELERGLSELDCQLQALRANLQRTADSVTIDMQGNLDSMSADLQDLRASHSTTSTDLCNMRSDVDESRQQLEDTRQLLDKTRSSTTQLSKHFDEFVSRENQMGARINDWKTQWSKLQPKLEAVTKDTAHLKQFTDHHEAAICSLQQGYATSFSSIETLQKQHVQMTFDVQSLQHGLSGAQRDLNDTREGLTRASQVSETLQGGLQKSDNEMRKACLKLDGLEAKHGALCSNFEKTAGCVAELSKEHRKSVNNVQSLKQELDKTNDNLLNARSQLECTENNIVGLKGEIGRTSDAVQRLDHGVEQCQATFTGLQKGFVETGATVARRSSALPRLSKVDRPVSATESTASCTSSRRSTMIAE